MENESGDGGKHLPAELGPEIREVLVKVAETFRQIEAQGESSKWFPHGVTKIDLQITAGPVALHCVVSGPNGPTTELLDSRFHVAALDVEPDIVFTITERVGKKARGDVNWSSKGLSSRAVSGDSNHDAINVGHWTGIAFQERPGDNPYCDPSGNCWFSVFADSFGRTGIGIHPDGGTPDATLGCIGLSAADTTAWHDALKVAGGKITCVVREAPTMRISPSDDVMESFERVLVELRVPVAQMATAMLSPASELGLAGFQIDSNFTPVPVTPHPVHLTSLAASNETSVIVRGTIDSNMIAELEAHPNVIKVWKDTPIAAFGAAGLADEQVAMVQPMSVTAPCPIGICDCSPTVAKGTAADVAAYLGVDKIWALGKKGAGMVVGIVDGGITAVGRPTKPGEAGTRKVDRVIGGFPVADWGTTAAAWGNHGNMTSTDALSMAPEAHVYDIRISDGNAVSNALAGFQWAINQHKTDGTPQVLSNSWGIYQKAWDPAYATDPNHPFTRKMVEAIDEGIVVLFAAGNCGATCPDSRCGADTGPGRDIWGANGHPRSLTVGAVNKNEQFVGYSSAGPAALDPRKPDICSITHFQGYFASDNGTSAATPIAAGVAALLKQAKPALSQDQLKHAFMSTAKVIGATGWDQYSGAGILRAKAAYDEI